MTDWALTEALYPLTKKLHFLLVSTWYISRVINLSGWTEDKDSKKQFKESRGDFAALNSDQGPAGGSTEGPAHHHPSCPRAAPSNTSSTKLGPADARADTRSQGRKAESRSWPQKRDWEGKRCSEQAWRTTVQKMTWAWIFPHMELVLRSWSVRI